MSDHRADAVHDSFQRVLNDVERAVHGQPFRLGSPDLQELALDYRSAVHLLDTLLRSSDRAADDLIAELRTIALDATTEK